MILFDGDNEPVAFDFEAIRERVKTQGCVSTEDLSGTIYFDDPGPYVDEDGFYAVCIDEVHPLGIEDYEEFDDLDAAVRYFMVRVVAVRVA